MKLSDIKGKRALFIIADAMELALRISEDERFDTMLEDFKALEDKDESWKVLFKHVPDILRDNDYSEQITSILAECADMPADKYAKEGDVAGDLFELLTSDSESLGFLLGSAKAGK